MRFVPGMSSCLRPVSFVSRCPQESIMRGIPSCFFVLCCLTGASISTLFPPVVRDGEGSLWAVMHVVRPWSYSTTLTGRAPGECAAVDDSVRGGLLHGPQRRCCRPPSAETSLSHPSSLCRKERARYFRITFCSQPRPRYHLHIYGIVLGPCMLQGRRAHNTSLLTRSPSCL